jgi:hypothetical protein
LGIVDVIKKKFQDQLCSSENYEVSINAAFTLANIAADPDLGA